MFFKKLTAKFALMGILVLPINLAWAEQPRVVTIGGSLTEIVYAIGQQDRLVGVDLTSLWPPAVKDLPQVGFYKKISAEGVLSLSPTHVFAYGDTEPATAVQQLKEAGVSVTTFGRTPPQDALFKNIATIGDLLSAPQKAEELIAQIKSDLDEIAQSVATKTDKPRVLFLLNYDPSQMLVAGRETVAHHLITLAGGVNVAGDLNGYKPLNSEMVTALAPDVVVSVDERWESMGGAEGMKKLPGMMDTPAGAHNRFVALPGSLILGLGPRIAEGVHLLSDAIHKEKGT